MSSRIYDLGLDTGLKGAWALLHEGELLHVQDLPWEVHPSWPDTIDARALHVQLLGLAPLIRSVGLEWAGGDAREGENRGSVHNFGVSCGVAYATLRILVPEGRIHRVRSAVWKAASGLSADKAYSCERAAALWPSFKDQFYGPRGGLKDGRAEAALLARWASRIGGS